jgi:hypothetical protein
MAGDRSVGIDDRSAAIVVDVRSIAATLVLLLALAACDFGSDERSGSDRPADTTTYTDPAGWTADVPVGWSVLSFETTKGHASAIGTQISNVDLPAPSIEPGLPIQTSGLVLPTDGIALVIATDEDPANVQSPPASPASPPLAIGDFAEGSSTGDGPTISLLWFKVSGHTLLASVKTGASASEEDMAAMARLVASIRASG